MKKLIITLFGVLCSLPGLSQHFTFDGVTMMQPLEKFQNKLEWKGYHTRHSGNGYFMPTGEYLGQEPQFFVVNGDTDDNHVSSILLGYSFSTKREADAFKRSAIRQLEVRYSKFKSSTTEGGGKLLEGNNGYIMILMGRKNEFASGDKIYPSEHQYVVSISFDVDSEKEYLNYSLTPGGVTIIKSPAAAKRHLTIPSCITIDDEPVKVVGVEAEAFTHQNEMESLTIGEGVGTIGEKAFAWCGKLSDIQLCEGLMLLGNSAFYGADSLRSIVLPASLQHFGTEVFLNCHNLNSITVREGSHYLKSDGNALYSADGSTLVCIPQAYQGTYRVPNGVKHIADWGMAAGNLTSVTLPDGLLTIGKHAFIWNKKMQSVNIPASVQSIGEAAFVQCHSLKEVVIPEGITTLPRSLFYNCKSLSHVSLPQSLTAIGNEAFEGCESLEELTLPERLETIGEDALLFCYALQSINVPASNVHYTSDDGVLMNKEGNMLVAFPIGRTGRYVVREGISTIAPGAFSGCKLKNVILPTSLRSIGDRAFSFTHYLREIKVPEGVTAIGNGAFDSGWNLEAVHLPSTVLTIGDNLCGENTTIFVPDAELSEYTFRMSEPTIRLGTPPKVKAASEYVPADIITLSDLTKKLLGLVPVKKTLWCYTQEELRQMIPESLPVEDANDLQDFALTTHKRLDLSIGEEAYKLFFVRIYTSANGKADVQETSIECGNETEKVARAIADQARKLKFKLVKHNQANENSVMMINKKLNTALFVIEDKGWERVFVVAVDVNSDKMKMLESRLD